MEVRPLPLRGLGLVFSTRPPFALRSGDFEGDAGVLPARPVRRTIPAFRTSSPTSGSGARVNLAVTKARMRSPYFLTKVVAEEAGRVGRRLETREGPSTRSRDGGGRGKAAARSSTAGGAGGGGGGSHLAGWT